MMCGIVLLFWFAQYVYVPYQTTYLTSQNIAMDTVGMILGIYGGIQMCFRMPIGIYGDLKKQHSMLIILGTAFAGMASVMRILFPAGLGFLAGNVLAGFGSSMWSAFMALFLGLYPAEQKQAATGRIMYYNNMGKLTAFICAAIFYQFLGMRFLCMMGVAAGFAAAVGGIWIRRKQPAVQGKADFGFSFRFLSSRLIVFSVLTLMQQGVQMSTAMSYTSEVLKGMGASQLQIGLSSIIYMAASVYFSGVISSEPVKKRGPRFWIPAAFLTVWGYCWLVPRVSAIWMIWLCQIAAGLQTGLLFTWLIAEAVEGIDEKQRATALAFFQMTYAVGMTVFPMISGAVSEQYGLSSAFYMLGVVGLAGCVISGGYYKIHNKEREN